MNPLYYAVREGIVRFILLVAPPRSVSTGIAVALSQSPDVDFYIHEPFSNDYSNIPSASSGAKLIGNILKEYKCNFNITPDNPVTILIKEISTNLRPLHFHYLSQYSVAVIIMVRSPLLQLSSIAKICKWVWEGSPRGYKFNIRSLDKKDLDKYKKNGDLEVYFLDSWRYIGSQVRYLNDEWPGNVYASFNWFVIDSEVVRSNPVDALKQISRRLGIRFSNKMISGWRKDHLFNIENDQWAKKTVESNCLYRPRRACPIIEDIPKSWHQMVKEANYTYAGLLFNGNFINPDFLSLNDSLYESIDKSSNSFIDAAPDTYYILSSVFFSSNERRNKFQSVVRQRYPKFKTTFDFLDQIVTSNRKILQGCNIQTT